MTALFDSAQLGPVTLRNRFIKAATFEGRSPDAVVTDDLVEFHRAVAAGGVGMTTVAYLAVSPEGRTHAESIYLRPEALPGLRQLTEAVHAEGAAVAAQIGHSGPVANAASNKAQGLAPGRFFNPLGMRRTKAATEGDIARVTQDFARGTRLCRDAGFDSVEVHLGHNYLLSSFLSPLLNRRKDRWGGSLENRARFARQVLEAVRDAAGDEMAVTVKLNLVDGVRGGFSLPESVQVAQWLEADGTVDAIELTGGSSLANPMFLFKGGAPVPEFAATLPWFLRTGFRLVGKGFLKEYPFTEGYFLDMARTVRENVSVPLILLGGVSSLETAQRGIDEGFEFVAMARALLHDPDLVNRFRDRSQLVSGCIHCNRCMPTIYTRTRCPLVEPEPGDRPIEVPVA